MLWVGCRKWGLKTPDLMYLERQQYGHWFYRYYWTVVQVNRYNMQLRYHQVVHTMYCDNE